MMLLLQEDESNANEIIGEAETSFSNTISYRKMLKNLTLDTNKQSSLRASKDFFRRNYQTKVNVYAIFQKVEEIDNVKEVFKAKIYIESRWQENSIDSEEIFFPKNYWNPLIYVQNVSGKIKEEIKYKIEKKNSENIVCEMRSLESLFTERLELYNFPLDVQDLGIEITTERSKNEVLFEMNKEHESAINMETFHAKQEWNLYSKMNIEKSFINDVWKEHKRPVYKISCKISRKPGYYLNNVFMLVFVVSVLGFVPFSCDVNNPHFRVPINLILILSSINFRWVVTQRLPPVSYLTILDKYALSGLFFLALLACWHAIVTLFSKDSRHLIDQIMFFIFISFFIFFHIVYICIFLFKYSLYHKLDESHEKSISSI